MTKVITQLQLLSIKPEQHGTSIALAPSVSGTIRIGKAGTISVYASVRVRINQKISEITLGTWSAKDGKPTGKSLKAILDEAAAIKAKVREGIDPKLERQTERLEQVANQQQALVEQQQRLQVLAAQQARMTVQGLFELFTELELKRRKDAGASVLLAFNKYAFPYIGGMAVEDVKKAHIREILDNIQRQATPKMPLVRTAKVVLAELRQMFGFAVERDYIEYDPTAAIKKAKLGEEKERQRYLKDAEIIELLQKLPKSGMAETSQLALLLQLATGARIGEILGARWQHINQEAQTWHLPETKNGHAHTIHLSDYTAQLLSKLHSITGSFAFLFPASNLDNANNRSVCLKTVTKQVADRQRGAGEPMQGRSKDTNALELAGGKWTPHDLRRSFETGLIRLRVLPEIAHKCTNHREQDKVKRTYQVEVEYEEHMREAWELWGRHMELLSAKAQGKLKNVILMPAKSA